MGIGRITAICIVFCILIFLSSSDASSEAQNISNFLQEQSSDPLASDKKETILVFGGNGFLGSEVVEALIPTGYKLVLVSRGNWYFDSSTRITPHVNHIVCDRYEDGLKDCELLIKLIQHTDHFKYVIDFSAYTPEVIEDAVHILKGKVGLYIYISTDSVYEVIVKNHTEPSKETDAVRPDDPILRQALAKKDDYGDKKLAAEEALQKQRGGGFPYVFLRLPDVVGPRDTTNRWWTYQLWIKFYHKIQIPIFVPPEVQELRLSFVYVKDVAQAVLKVMEKDEEIWDQAFNLAIDKEFTLSHLLLEMSTEMEIDGVQADYEQREDTFFLYPSVFNGQIDISKAKKQLEFQPTPWKEVLKDTVNFYEDAFFTYPAMRDKALSTLISHVIPSDNEESFYEVLEAYKSGHHDTATVKETKEEL